MFSSPSNTCFAHLAARDALLLILSRPAVPRGLDASCPRLRAVHSRVQVLATISARCEGQYLSNDSAYDDASAACKHYLCVERQHRQVRF